MLKAMGLMIQGDELREKSRLNPNFFTRNRKVGFSSIINMILNIMRKSLQLEIDEFMELIHNKDNKISYTKQSFSEARQKLSPDAFKFLNDQLISDFYADNNFSKYKGYRLLACDASILEIPNNPETKNIYGYAKNGYGLKLARAMSSDLYDIENGIIISAKLDKYTSSERTLAKENIEKMLSYEHNHIKNLILFDRGYPSIDLILFLQKREISFVMRVQSNFLREITEAPKNDQLVTIEITKDRLKELKKRKVDVKLGQILKLRVIKIKLDSGEEEILITNLSQDELSYKEAKELYFKRWGIETKFDELKNKLEIENFSGVKPLTIEQDFYASLVISNFAALIRQVAEEDLKTSHQNKDLKHKYKINNNILIGKLKINLILLLLEENDEKKAKMYDELLQEIQRNIIPIRKNRQFSRTKTIQSNKYSKNKRRCL